MAFSVIELIVKPPDRPVIRYDHGSHEAFILQLLDDSGCPKDLTPYQIVGSEPEVDGPCRLRRMSIQVGLLFVVRDYLGQTVSTLTKEISIYGDDPTQGRVYVDLEPCDLCFPGVYLAEVQMVENWEMRDVSKMYLEATPSLAWRSTGPITVAEIRLWTRDWHPNVNDLLDEVEYKDHEIAAAIRRGVDLWNSVPPYMASARYSPSTFPEQFRSPWIDVTIGFLKEIAADWYDRNHLSYQAGGVAIDDRNKGPLYRQQASAKLQEFKAWVKEAKVALNIDGAWGRLGYRFLP